MTNKNQIKLTSETTAVVSKGFLKKASIYGSAEYKVLKNFKAENPGIQVSAREIRKKSGKITFKNLTYANMISHIEASGRGAELLVEFERQKKMAKIAKNPYRAIVNWFKATCFDTQSDFEDYRNSIALQDINEMPQTQLVH